MGKKIKDHISANKVVCNASYIYMPCLSKALSLEIHYSAINMMRVGTFVLFLSIDKIVLVFPIEHDVIMHGLYNAEVHSFHIYFVYHDEMLNFVK